MEDQRNNQQNNVDPRQGKNETLNDPGAQVADYGRTGQGMGLDNGGTQQQEQQQRQGNSSIPVDEEDGADTIGNP
jgi:hypothetical protein